MNICDHWFETPNKFRNGLIYGIYCISSWLAPPLVTLLGPRMAMMLAAITYLVQVYAEKILSKIVS